MNCHADQTQHDRTASISFVQRENLQELFRCAAARQTEIMVQNILGQGVDIHLLGLREACNDKGVQSPDLFADDSYKISQCFLLSTSQVYDVLRVSGSRLTIALARWAQRTFQAPSNIIRHVHFTHTIMHTNECTNAINHQFQCSSTSNELHQSSISHVEPTENGTSTFALVIICTATVRQHIQQQHQEHG